MLVVPTLMPRPLHGLSIAFFRVHQDSVFPRALDTVHSRIRVFQQFPGIGCHIRRSTNPDTDGQAAADPIFAAVDFPDLPGDIFREHFCGIGIISRQNQRKFLTVNAGGISIFSHTGSQDFANPLESQISLIRSVQLVVKLKVINIEYAQGQGGISGLVKLPVQQLVEIFPADQARQLIPPGLIQRLFVQARIFQGNRAKRGNRLQKVQITDMLCHMIFLFGQQHQTQQFIFTHQWAEALQFQ